MKEQQKEILNLLKEEFENKREYFLYDFSEFETELKELLENEGVI